VPHQQGALPGVVQRGVPDGVHSGGVDGLVNTGDVKADTLTLTAVAPIVLLAAAARQNENLFSEGQVAVEEVIVLVTY
jgi:hypothetical protein